MRLILLGPPGCGKGTQAELLCRRNRLEHIRAPATCSASHRPTHPDGQAARPFIDAGPARARRPGQRLIAERFQPARPARRVRDGRLPADAAQADAFDRCWTAVALATDERCCCSTVAGRGDRAPAERPVELPAAGLQGDLPHRRAIRRRWPGICDDCGTCPGASAPTTRRRRCGAAGASSTRDTGSCPATTAARAAARGGGPGRDRGDLQ